MTDPDNSSGAAGGTPAGDGSNGLASRRRRSALDGGFIGYGGGSEQRQWD